MFFSAKAQLVNDDCSGAINLTVSSTESCTNQVSATTEGATPSGVESPCYGEADDDIWFSFVATATAHTISISNKEGEGIDTYFQVLKGSCDNLTAILCSDWDSKTVSGLTVGEKYYVRAYSFYAERSVSFDICVSTPSVITQPPSNDLCENAIPISCGETLTGTTVNSTNQIGGLSGDVFYSYTGNGTPELVTVSLCGSSYNTFLAVYTNCGLKEGIVSDNDGCGDGASKLTFLSDGTSTYIIVVDGYTPYYPFEIHGDFVIAVTCESLSTIETKSEKLQVYPNPVKDVLFISKPQEIKEISVYDITGKLVLKNLKSDKGQVNVSKLLPGNYILKAVLINGTSESIKIIKK